jgi:Ca-activated chloride channel family protein
MRPEIAPYWFGGTNIGKAVQGCKKLLVERDEGDRMILLITDGIDFDLDTVGTELAKELKTANIVVFGVIVGYHQIQDGMVTITRGTGGDAFTVDDPDALKVVFRRIDQMKQAKVEKTIAEPMDHYRPFALAGLVLLGLGNLCQFGMRYVPW